MPFFLFVIPPLILALLLFWQKRKLNILIIFHIALVMALYARGFILEPKHWHPSIDNETKTLLFEYIYNTMLNSLYCFIILWIYEWWYIGKRRSELKFE